MTYDCFRNDDPDLFLAYQKAYLNKIHTQSFVNGLYVNLAINNAIFNAFRKSSDKPMSYPTEPIFNPYLKHNESDEDSNENTELGYRKKVLKFY